MKWKMSFLSASESLTFLLPGMFVKKRLILCSKAKHGISPNRGFFELRQEICKWVERKYHVTYHPESEVLVTVGGSEAIDLCIRTLINPGDEVLIPEPSFVCYVPMTEMAKGVPVTIETKMEDNFRLTAKALREKITPKTKLLILPFPNNPTGAVMRREHLEEIAEVVREHNLLVLSDEIYGELTYGKESHVCFAEIEGMRERTVVVNGFSKTYAMTGWRLGYAVGPHEIIDPMTKLHQYAIMEFSNHGTIRCNRSFENGDDDIAYMRNQYDARRRLIVDSFNAMGLTCFEPEGAFMCSHVSKAQVLHRNNLQKNCLEKNTLRLFPEMHLGTVEKVSFVFLILIR